MIDTGTATDAAFYRLYRTAEAMLPEPKHWVYKTPLMYLMEDVIAYGNAIREEESQLAEIRRFGT